ncbi:uncharacterized protein ACLA_002160 [Aspergillus clavatus NRRL 1]|uniref:Uncharacterized protein n=1 Tax=Aspergillus clavatus (strain ATCC 1007 / CBS 513.65 / DSM 816 / NCTC 3887 / NRRL 1 / QM 1276 / 107) TaxID=344612 RepID=A1C537_ASPCL|nr:uncharacterized protein ACLA_002160 [Aspergillus clavatus NRRL 1]EAW14805.1 hypothetical protein ACLA_002160 [Aspergillus clavatus NRRL 1]
MAHLWIAMSTEWKPLAGDHLGMQFPTLSEKQTMAVSMYLPERVTMTIDYFEIEAMVWDFGGLSHQSWSSELFVYEQTPCQFGLLSICVQDVRQWRVNSTGILKQISVSGPLLILSMIHGSSIADPGSPKANSMRRY